MFFVLRNKLPRLAATKITAQAPHWSERASSGSDSEDDCELFTSHHRPTSTAMWPGAIDRSHLRFSTCVDGRALPNSRPTYPWQEHDKTHHQLRAAANFFSKHCGGMENVLVMNLGDPWKDPSHLQLFDHRVVDMPANGKNVAPGSDLIPLDILFTICSSMHSWLRINNKNVTFLYANNTAAGSGKDTLKFVVGCYLAYLGDSDTTTPVDPTQSPHQQSDEAHWKVNNKAFMSPQEPDSEVSQLMYNVGIDTNKIANYGGPARKRYAQYFLSILHTPNPPPSQETPLAIDNVIITGLDEIKTNLRITRHLSEKWKDCLLHPVLVIYQKGNLKWKQIVPIKDSTVEVSPEVSVMGDSVIGLWFVKDCISTNDPPVVAFSFHSAFMEAGVVRLSSGDLTCLGKEMRQVLNNDACNVTMELTLTHGEFSDEEEEEVSHFNWSDYRNKWLSQTGGLPSIYDTVANFQKTEAPTRKSRHSLSDVPPLDGLQKKEEQTEKENASIPTLQPQPSQKDDKDEGLMEAPLTPIASESTFSRLQFSQVAADTPTDSDVKKQETNSDPPKPNDDALARKKSTAPAPKPPPPPPSPRSRPRKSSPFQRSASTKNRPVSKTKSFFWDIAPKQSGTVWCDLAQPELDPSRMSMLETLFSNDGQTKTKAPSSGLTSTAKKSGSTLALSVGRANNVSIMMTRFKHFSGIDEICRAVLTGEGMTDEELDLLSQIGPTEGEIREMKEHNEDDLSVPEKILMGMTVVPRLRLKASSQLAMRHWESNYSRAVDMLATIVSSCQQLRESRRLQRVFASVLTVGNTMNQGTSRGNAGCIKIESLSRLWDTRVSGTTQTRPPAEQQIQRVGSVPTAISQALEPRMVEQKIATLLDFVAVIVHDKEVSLDGGVDFDDYLLNELDGLMDAVHYLEDGVDDLLAEVYRGFDMLEREFRGMSGKQWDSIDSSLLSGIKIRNCNSFVEEQRVFLQRSHEFLMSAGGARNFLRQEKNAMEQHISSAIQWLGENNNDNPRVHLKRLLEFAKRFDQSYKRLQLCTLPIAE